MTALESSLDMGAVLEGLYGLSAGELGLSPETYAARLTLWNTLAARNASLSAAQQEAVVRTLALRSWVTRLIGQADKFRAEGDIAVERDIMARVALLRDWLKEAEAELPAAVTATQHTSNPAPELQEWGLR